MALRELPKYKKPDEGAEEAAEENGQQDDGENKPITAEFSEKTDQLLEYIEKTYLKEIVETDGQGKAIIAKMKLDNSVKVME